MLKKLLIWSAIINTICFGQNLLNNGDFENGFSQWQNLQANGGVATYTLDSADVHGGDYSMKVDVVTLGSDAWDVQSIHPGWSSDSSREYIFGFWAKSTGSAALRLFDCRRMG